MEFDLYSLYFSDTFSLIYRVTRPIYKAYFQYTKEW